MRTTNPQTTHDNLREVWAIVSENPGISRRQIKIGMGISKERVFDLVDLLLQSGTLVEGQGNVHNTLRAPVPLLTLKAKR